MNNKSEQPKGLDEELLIDFLMGGCTPQQANEVNRRLADDVEFAALRDNLANALGGLDLADAPAAPADLVERTMSRISGQRKLNTLLASESRNQRRGTWSFSLREALAVAAAIILIFSAFMPSVGRMRHRVQAGLCKAGMQGLGQAFASFAADNDNALPSAPADSASGLFILARDGYATPEQFLCPAVPSKGKGDSIKGNKDMMFSSGDKVHYSYQQSTSYQPLSLDSPQLQDVRESMAILADSNPVFNAGKFHRENIDASSLNHRQQGQNVLYMDMHVEWQTTPKAGVAGDHIYLAGEDDLTYQDNRAPTDATDTFLLQAYSNGSTPPPPAAAMEVEDLQE